MTTAPKVEPKALEILESIRPIFASKGFDGASMQDLAGAAGMSAGNFYRYFPSKGAIVEAMITHHIDMVRSGFTQVMQAERPLQVIGEVLRARIETTDACEGPLMAEITASASRRPEIARLLLRMEQEVTESLVATFAKVTGLPEAAARARFSAHARLIFLLVRGVSLRTYAANAEPDRALAALVLKAIANLLDEVAACAAEVPEPERELS